MRTAQAPRLAAVAGVLETPQVWLLIDVAFASVLSLDLILEALLAHGVPSSGRLPSALAAVPFAAAVAFRRRWPRISALWAIGMCLVQQFFHGQMLTTLPSESAEFVPILCCYGVGAWVELKAGLWAIALAAAGLVGVGLIASAQHAPGAASSPGSDLAVALFFVLAPWAVGLLMRERHRRAEAFESLERQTILDRAERERAAAAEEREMIGRELQDIIAHSVSLMVVQAGGARRMLLERPDRARESILCVERTGREALAEMRRLLGVLRRDDDPRALAPQPGLAQLPELAEQMLGRGLLCEFEGAETWPLTPGIDLVAYRVIEAALARVVDRGGRTANIEITHGPRALRLEVAAAGVAGSDAAELRAVAERVALYDGRLEAFAEGGQLIVRCQLPLAGAAAA